MNGPSQTSQTNDQWNSKRYQQSRCTANVSSLTNEKDASKVDVSKSADSLGDGLFKIRQCKETQENERMTNGSKELRVSHEMNTNQFNLFTKKEHRGRKRGAHKQSAKSPSNKKKQSVGRNSGIKSSTIRSGNKASRSG